MKYVLAWICLLSACYAKPELVLNVKKDLHWYHINNIAAVEGNDATSRLQAIIDYNHIIRKDSAITLVFPAGKYLFDTTIHLPGKHTAFTTIPATLHRT